MESQGRPIVICDKDDYETIKNSSRNIKVPHCVDCLQGILSVIPLQLLSFHLAVLRGYDVSTPTSDHFTLISPRADEPAEGENDVYVN